MSPPSQAAAHAGSSPALHRGTYVAGSTGALGGDADAAAGEAVGGAEGAEMALAVTVDPDALGPSEPALLQPATVDTPMSTMDIHPRFLKTCFISLLLRHDSVKHGVAVQRLRAA